MIQIPQNEVQTNDYEKVVSDVLMQLTKGKDKHREGTFGTAYTCGYTRILLQSRYQVSCGGTL